MFQVKEIEKTTPFPSYDITARSAADAYAIALDVSRLFEFSVFAVFEGDTEHPVALYCNGVRFTPAPTDAA